MAKLVDLQLSRAGNLVTVQWQGSPKFSIGVLSTMSESEAFERSAMALQDESSRPGFAPDELKACVAEMRKQAKALREADR